MRPSQSFIVRAVSAFLCLIMGIGWPVLAQEEPSDQPTNPLEITTPDPLFPNPPNRPLTPAETELLLAVVEKLKGEAEAYLKAGNVAEAFKSWNRELRLRKFLGAAAEVEALTRVAQVAQAQNQRSQVLFISQRLQLLYLETKASGVVEESLLQAFAKAFLLVQARMPALQAHQDLLVLARQKPNQPALESLLKIIVDLHFAGFEYAEAAPIYEELLLISEKRNPHTIQDDIAEKKYLDQLAFIYDQIEQAEKALTIRNKILERYRQARDPLNVPALKIAMGRNLESLGRLNAAVQYYQEAYTLAWSIQQFGQAADALKKIARLYESQNKLDAAVEVYQALVVVQQRGTDFFGMMDTFDKMGKVHVTRKAYPQAIAAFQRGLELARQLKYQEDYFNRQITEIKQGNP